MRKIHHKLIAVLVAIAVIPLLFAVTQAMRSFGRWAAEEKQLELREQRKLFAAFVDEREAEVLTELGQFATQRATRDALTTRNWNRLLTQAITRADELAADAFFLTSTDGELLLDAAGPVSEETDPRFDLHVGLALSHQSSAGLVRAPGSGFGIAASAPIYSDAGYLLGVVTAFVPFDERWLRRLEDISGFDFTFAEGGIAVLSTSWTAGESIPAVRESSDPARPDHLETADEAIVLRIPLENLAGAAIGQLLISRSGERLRAAVRETSFDIVVMALSALIIATLAGIFFSHQITAPLAELSHAAERLARDEPEVEIAVRSRDEIGRLAASFAHMARRVEERTAKLRAAREELADRERDALTQLDAAREELLRKQRLAILGELAGSVAHEVRNPLGVMKSSTYFLRLTGKLADPKGKEHLERIERQIHRADRIVTELLDYARVPKSTPQRFALREAAEKAIAETSIPDTVELRYEPGQHPLLVEADPEQIERILGNFLRNAIQAMPGHGTLAVVCRQRDGEVIAAVSDTGVGIAAENLAKIFEPLYTSRTRGIGLGLAVAQRYAQLNRGRIDCESEPGRGTTFRLALPVSKEGEPDEPAG